MDEAYKTGHKQATIVLKTATVDEAMLPVLRWLNSYHGVYTLWSCQGDDRDPEGNVCPPYVSFFCAYAKDMKEIEAKLAEFSKTIPPSEEMIGGEKHFEWAAAVLKDWPSLDSRDDGTCVCYHLHFSRESDVPAFVKFLGQPAETALAHCPFCGCEDVEWLPDSLGAGFERIACMDCGCCSPAVGKYRDNPRRPDVEARWNRRVSL